MEVSEPIALPRDRILVIGNQRFSTIDKVIKYINRQPKDRRYNLQRELSDNLMRFRDAAGRVIEVFYEYVCNDQSWKQSRDAKTFAEEWRDVKIVVRAVKKDRNRLAEARREIIRVWGDKAKELLATITTGNLMVTVRKCARNCSLKKTLLGVNESIVDRISTPKRGVSTTVAPLAGDFERVLQGLCRFQPQDQNTLRKYGLCMGKNGVLKKGDVDETMEGVTKADSSSSESESEDDPPGMTIGDDPTGNTPGDDPPDITLGDDPNGYTLDDDPPNITLGHDPTGNTPGDDPPDITLGHDPNGYTLDDDPPDITLGDDPTGYTLDNDPPNITLGNDPTGYTLGIHPRSHTAGNIVIQVDPIHTIWRRKCRGIADEDQPMGAISTEMILKMNGIKFEDYNFEKKTPEIILPEDGSVWYPDNRLLPRSQKWRELKLFWSQL